MLEFEMQYFLGSLLMALAVAGAWLALSLAIAHCRGRPGLRYGPALLLSWLPALVAPGGLTIFSVMATLLCDAGVCFAVVYFSSVPDLRRDQITHEADALLH